jgi:peptide/nickel transport system substrate-binding protein
MSAKPRISRRQFIQVSALAAAGTVAAACVPATATPPAAQPVSEGATPVQPAAAAAKYSEAPSLAALVAEGKLPPVEERLPVEPFVVGPGVLIPEEDLDWEVGEYSREGEVLRAVTTNPTWDYCCQHAQEHFLNTPPHHTGPVTGNILSSWSVNEDCTAYEFTLRKGLKWSDGVPVTTEDIRFVYDEVLLDPELTPIFPDKLRAGAKPGAEPMTLEVVDDFTFKISFGAPNGTRFLADYMGMGNLWAAYTPLLKPKHYLQQFHKNYVPKEELEAKCKAAGFGAGEWYRLFQEEGGNWGGMDCEPMASEGRMPVLRGWIIQPPTPDLIVLKRNPYYWKVDTKGQQLPYVERMESVVVSDPESVPLKIVAGEVNYIRERLRHTDISMYKEHEQEYGYRVTLDMVYHNAPVALYLNFNHPNEAWRQILWQKEFRYALNAAIDYQEIIQALFLGMGKTCPWIPDVSDKDMANQLLDKLGLDKRDSDGWRIGPDGKRFEVPMDVATDPLFIKPAEIIRTHLEEVGLYTPLRMMEGSLWGQMRDANELYACVEWCDDCNWPYLKDDYMPDPGYRLRWGMLWHKWMQTDGKDGEEPPDWIKDLYTLYEEMMAINPDTTRAAEAEKRFADWFMEYVPLFPLARDVVDPCIVPVNAGNIAHSGRSSAVWFSEEQIFFKHA